MFYKIPDDLSYRWWKFYWLPQGSAKQVAKYAGLVFLISIVPFWILPSVAYNISSFWLFTLVSSVSELFNVAIAYATLLLFVTPLVYLRNTLKSRQNSKKIMPV
jgi:membrane protein YdbS with pleckstrin-like domain